MRAGAILLCAALGLATLGACAKTVKQDARTGEDGRWKGARAVVLEAEGATRLVGESKGIVTYPGGDRVDWRLIELPADRRGHLELELSWTAPRPGLDLSFDVYNEWGRKLDSAEPRRQKKDRGKKRLALDGAKGKIFVEVYASSRGDAGKYKLDVRFEEVVAAIDTSVPWNELDVPGPPPLAAVPGECISRDYDPSNPECIKNPPRCTATDWNAKNPGCEHVCPSPADASWPACKTPEDPPPETPEPEVTGPTTAEGKVMNVSISDSWTVVHVEVGPDHPVQRGWTGQILDDRGKPMKGGDFVVKTTRTRQVTGMVKLKRDSVEGKKVILRAP